VREAHVEVLRRTREAEGEVLPEIEEPVLAPELRVGDGVERPGGDDRREQRPDAEVTEEPAARLLALAAITPEDGVGKGEQSASGVSPHGESGPSRSALGCAASPEWPAEGPFRGE